MKAILKINGQSREFTEKLPETLTQLLRTLNIDEATVVAELDGRIIPRAEFGTVAIHDGATIELVRFVGGG